MNTYHVRYEKNIHLVQNMKKSLQLQIKTALKSFIKNEQNVRTCDKTLKTLWHMNSQNMVAHGGEGVKKSVVTFFSYKNNLIEQLSTLSFV